MKKSILLALAIFTYAYSFAQVNFGVKAGASLNSIAQSSYGTSVGYNAGILAKIIINNKIFIQPEVQYSVKGEHFPSTGLSSAGVLGLRYLAVPVLFGYSPAKKLSIVLGPEFGFLLKANSHFDDSNHDVSNNYQKFDIGIDLGASYAICDKVGVELRYNYGFQDLQQVTFFPQPGTHLIGSNRVLQLGLCYMLKH